MIPVMQTVEHGAVRCGNCFAACVASLLECSIDDVPWPNRSERDDWSTYWIRISEWLKLRGMTVVFWRLDVRPVPWCGDVAGGTTGRGDVKHAVVMKGCEMIHDIRT